MTTKKEEGLHLILVDKFRKIQNFVKNTRENSQKIPSRTQKNTLENLKKILLKVQKNTPQKSGSRRQNHIRLGVQ